MAYTAHVAGKLYRDFSPWVDSFGETFCKQLANSYGPSCLSDRLASEASYYCHVKAFLDYFAEADCATALRHWLIESFGKVSDVPKSIRAHYGILLASYRNHIEGLRLTQSTKNNKVSGVQWLLRMGENAGLFPEGLGITGFCVPPRVGRGSTFLDVNMQGEVDFGYLMSEAKRILGEDFFHDGETHEELKTLIENLLLEVGEIDREGFDPYSHALVVLNNRIKRLKSRCAEIIVEHIKLFREAGAWNRHHLFVEKARQLHHAFQDYSGGARQQAKRYREILDDNPLEILTVYAFKYFGGRYPLYTESLYGVWSQRAQAYSISTNDLRCRLGAPTKLYAACHAFICFEVAGNPDSITNLTVDALTCESGVYRLYWHKYRRGSQNIEKVSVKGMAQQNREDITGENVTVVDVFNHLKQVTGALRPDAPSVDKDKLFLSHFKNASNQHGYVPTCLHPATLNRHFKEVCRDVSGGVWESTPKAIRGSALLFEGMLTGDATQVAAKGRHSSLSMASKYTYHIPEILRREINIRKFLDWFETLLTIDINDFAVKIGIDAEAYDRRAVELNRQFGGIHCVDAKQGVQPGTAEGEVCHRVDRCPSCENRRNIFVMSESNLVSLLHWNEALEEAEKELPPNDFKKWLLWRLFTSSMLERIESQDQHARLLEDAVESQRSMENPYRGLIPVISVTEDIA